MDFVLSDLPALALAGHAARPSLSWAAGPGGRAGAGAGAGVGTGAGAGTSLRGGASGPGAGTRAAASRDRPRRFARAGDGLKRSSSGQAGAAGVGARLCGALRSSVGVDEAREARESAGQDAGDEGPWWRGRDLRTAVSSARRDGPGPAGRAPEGLRPPAEDEEAEGEVAGAGSAAGLGQRLCVTMRTGR